MTVESKGWMPAERVFRIWMLISTCMYVLGCVSFVLIGQFIPPVINSISRAFLPLPLYPLPADTPEGAFWRVLAVSMMAMITWICAQAYRDPRKHGNLVAVLLVSKGCSTLCYTVFFILYGHLAYIIGFVTDGPIFLITAALWYAAAGGERCLTAGEERILMAIGDAFMPRGGRFAFGYDDAPAPCLADTSRMLSALDMRTMVMIRLSLHLLNWASIPTFRRRLTSLALHERVQVLTRLEVKRNALLRMVLVTAKVLTIAPFFERPEAIEAVGYDPEGRVRP